MKRMMIAGALALMAGGQALAADLPVPAAPPPKAPATYVPAPPVFTWTGIYIGLNGGWGFGKSDWNNAVGTPSISTSGGTIGGTIGGNYQVGGFVLGVEADGDWSDLNGNVGCGVGAGIIACETKSQWLATFRGRAGYAFDRILLYGTAGGAFGNIEAGANGGPFDSSNKAGWTAGAGLEFGITPNFTVKVEGLYVDLSSANCAASCGPIPVSVTFKEELIRVGLNWKFL